MSFVSAPPTVGPQTLAYNHSEKIVPEQEEKDLQRPYVVLGFSGARVIDLAKDIVQIVQHVLGSHRVAIVCSAKSDSTGVGGVTDPNETMTRLPSTVRESVNHEFRSYVAIVKAIRIDHIESAKPLLRNPAVLADYIQLVNAECDRLMEILKSLPHLDGVSNPIEHKTFGKGTNLSCILMAALLQDRGVDAQYVDLGDAISRDLPPALRQEIVSCDKRVPVMTSLFEGIPGGPNNAIGKSPIDLCAASVAAGVGAQELQIWAEVDGFFTVDPRRVPGARLIPSVTPSEATQLLSHSSKDIQAFAIEQAIRARIPVCIKNVLNPHGSGTMISLDDVIDAPSCIGTSSTLTAGCKDSVQKQSSFNFAPTSHSKRPTAITIKDRIMVLNVHSNKLTSAHGFLMYLFRVLDKWNLSVHSDPSSLPANVKLQLGNVLEPFPEEMLGKYDLVRVKLLYAALKKDEWLLAARNLKTLLKPGGYLFWSEIGAYGYASNPYSEAFHEWKRIESEAAVKLGRDPKCPVLLPYQFRQAGFEGVDEKVFVTLGRPDLINIITKMALFYMPQNLNGLLKLGVMSPDLTEGKVNSLVETVTKETENGVEIGTNFHWVWGQNLGSS